MGGGEAKGVCLAVYLSKLELGRGGVTSALGAGWISGEKKKETERVSRVVWGCVAFLRNEG